MTHGWILLRKNNPDAAKAKLIHNLFNWCLQDGQQYAPIAGYVPLPAAVVVKGLAAFETITSSK